MNSLDRERVDYAARCDVLRTERHQRALLVGEEEQIRADVHLAFAEVSERLQGHQESERLQQHLRDKVHYTVQLHRNPTSPMPTLDTVALHFFEKLCNRYRLSAPKASSSPSANEIADLLLWEEENRHDLQAWERDERREMVLIILSIVSQQREHERRARERVCEGVLSGATVLDWSAYPSYST